MELAMFKIPLIGLSGYARFYVVALENLVMIANSMSSPIMLLIFNRDVQKLARGVFQNNTTPTVLAAPPSKKEAWKTSIK
ncbi:hypothetical protein KIN20_005725 [Parelaphostrongylus tenuis]|uniref:Uncharacterized protein n=1 Tax=Parelaphostrongylus tenuis TaxID=148309 RepID=A0AAD5M0T1_PARTN|nr:hypothetical protein KIN20_005725 [Parelaphostrongylus tenuis]